ncbi:MAG: DUF4105 domain-containing protein, partial [Pseudomonadota bacterium]
GRMVYYAVARDPSEELGYYQWRDREVLAQRLNLTESQFDRLVDWLERHTSPELRNFHYDYYFNNCSNRVRDALDYALSGQLRLSAEVRPADQNFRAHTRRLIQDAPLLYLGIHTGLGRMVDQPRSAWEAMFLPEVLARELRMYQSQTNEGDQEPLVLEERVLVPSSRPEPSTTAAGRWTWFVVLGLLTTALLWLSIRIRGRPWRRLCLIRIWMLITALSGCVLVFLWLGTEHRAAWQNENLLLLNPLLLLMMTFRPSRAATMAAGLVGLGLVMSLGLKLLPGAQWNYDLLLWLWPAQTSVVWIWWRAVRRAPHLAPEG